MAKGDHKDLEARVAELEQQLAEEREEAEWDLKAARESSAAVVKKLEDELAALRKAGGAGTDEVLTQRALMAERKVAELQEELKRARDLAPSQSRPAEDSLLRQRAEAAEQERDDLRREKRALQRTLDERERALKRAEDKSGNTAELKRQLEEVRRDLLAKERELTKARIQAAEGEKGEAELERLGRELSEARGQLEENEEYLTASQGRVREMADELGRIKEELARTRMASGQMLEQRERETERLKNDLSAAEADLSGHDRQVSELKAKKERLERELAVAQQERDQAVSALRRFRDAETTAVGRPGSADPFDEQTQRVAMDQVGTQDRSREKTQPDGAPAVEGSLVADQAAGGDGFPRAAEDSRPPGAPKPFAKGDTELGEPPMPTPDEEDVVDRDGEGSDRDAVVEAFERQAPDPGLDEMPTPSEDEAAGQPRVVLGSNEQAEAVAADWMDREVENSALPPQERTAEVRSLRAATSDPSAPPGESKPWLKWVLFGGGGLALAGLVIVGALVFFPRWFGTEGVDLGSARPQPISRPDASVPGALGPDGSAASDEPTAAGDAQALDGGVEEPAADEDQVEQPPERSPQAQRELEKAWAKARALIKKRKYRPALKLLGRWVKKEPDEPVMRYLYGQALYRGKKARASLVQLERAVALEPEYAEAWYELGGVYIKLHQKAKGREALERFLELAPQDRRAKAVQKNLRKLR